MKTDTLARRLRWERPQPVVNRLVLTKADQLLFEAIGRHGPLSSRYLYEFTRHVRRDWTHLQNRLTEFYNGDAGGPYLTRPSQQFSGFNARYQHLVYDLAPRARRLGPAETRTRKDPFLHQLMQACVGASFELLAPTHGLRYIHRDEILARAGVPLALSIDDRLGRATALVPDDLFGFEYPGAGFRFFAVEIDRNTESIESRGLAKRTLARKIAAYLAVLRDRLYLNQWSIPNLNLLVVTTNRTHARNLIEHIRRQQGPYRDRIAIACEPSFGANWQVPRGLLTHLLKEPLMTVIGMKNIGVP